MLLRPFTLLLAAFAAVGLLLSGCGGGDAETSAPPASIQGGDHSAASPTNNSGGTKTQQNESFTSQQGPVSPPPKPKPPKVSIKTNHGEIIVQLDPENAPVTVDNFLENYVKRDFYDGVIFHYVSPGPENGMILTGAFDQQAEPKETRAEIRNEAHNGLKNVRGTIAMARYPEIRHSATSQFFINVTDNPELDHKNRETDEDYGYCVFGKVIKGMEVVDRIAKSELSEHPKLGQTPAKPVIIESIQQVQQ